MEIVLVIAIAAVVLLVGGGLLFLRRPTRRPPERLIDTTPTIQRPTPRVTPPRPTPGATAAPNAPPAAPARPTPAAPVEPTAEATEPALEPVVEPPVDDVATPPPAPVAEPPVPTVDELESLLEEPAPVRPSFRDRLGKARSVFAGAFGSVRSRAGIDQDSWDDLEEALLRADVGVGATMDLLDAMRERVSDQHITSPDALLDALKG